MKAFTLMAITFACVVASGAGLGLAADQAYGAETAGAGIDTVAAAGPVALALVNGWTGGPFSTNQPSVQQDSQVVRFKGAIATSGTNTNPFVLPKSFRPSTNVYTPIDLCNATNGRLFINTNGVVTVQAQTNFSNAQCFTSLDGASFVKNPTNYQNLALQNGWTNAPFGTSNAAVRVISGVVQFKGALASGTTNLAFVLPAGFRPTTNVYVYVDMCNAKKGRIDIAPNGSVTIEPSTTFADAQCFTSLEGVSFVRAAARPLTLRNGWTGAPYGTAAPAVSDQDGIVRFKGGMFTSGTSAQPFVLPPAYRPSAETYIKVDMCNATNGRLYITPAGVVSVQAESAFTNASCFTSLDGASFVK